MTLRSPLLFVCSMFLAGLILHLLRLLFASMFSSVYVDLWNVYGECENYCVLKGHQGSILEIDYSNDGR